MKVLQWLVGDVSKREQKRLAPLVRRINDLEPLLEALSDEALLELTAQFKLRLAEGLANQRLEQEVLEELLPEAFAAVREAAKRTLGMRHFDEQLLGGMVLHSSKIAEMKTGEGKTLVATLPAYLNAIAGHGVHVVTVNDYLAKRDAQWMGKVYHALGVTVAAIGHEQSWHYLSEDREQKTENRDDPSSVPRPPSSDPDWPNLRPITRKEAYATDITYGTNNEFGFDYLRDNMAQNPAQLVQRELHYAIVDEVDSILIDEARTPLIISAPAEESTNLYQTFAGIAKRLKRETDYTVDEKFRSVALSDDGLKKVEEWTGLPNLYAPEHVQLVHHLEEALKAQALFARNKDYVVREGEVVIVDEFTGRLMPGRRYSEGLHQAIEAKEGVEIKRESNTLATISFQNLFRLYAKLSGMTGTAATESEEFWKIYGLEVIEIPTHRTMVRVDHQDFIYKTEAGKLAAVIEEIKRRQEKGQPVLIGTISIEKNEKLSRLLKQAGIKHQVLNAKHHEREAKIIANAGKVGAVTLATNMAGRGVDIILGGEPPKQKTEGGEQKTEATKKKSVLRPLSSDTWKGWEEEHQKVLELGGLCVIGTERHEARRIDNQLRGRSGRQGDPGESQFYVSMEDELMRIFGGEQMKAMMERLGLPDDQPIQAKLISGSIESAQRRVEGHNFDIRKHLVEYDDVANKHREYLYRLRREILLGEQKTEYRKQNDEFDPSSVLRPPSSDSDWLHHETLELMDDAQRKSYEEKAKAWGELTHQVERAVWLRTIDTFWVEHLNAMEALRTGIGLRGYGQHDPLVAYRQEAYHLFERLKRGIEQEVVRLLLAAEVTRQQPIAEQQAPQSLQLKGADDTKSVGFAPENREQKTENRNEQASSTPKLGRNEPCYCGSGKKYKKCHGR